MADAVEAEAEEVVKVVGVRDRTEEVKEDQGIKVREEEEIKVIKDQGVKDKEETSTTPTRLLVMLIFPHLRPVSGTGPSGSPHISAWSLAPVHGASTGSPSPTTNEVPTSSSPRKTTERQRSFINCCTLTRKK